MAATPNRAESTTAFRTLAIVCCLFVWTSSPTYGQIPTLADCPPFLLFPEDTLVGTLLHTIEGRVRQGSYPTNNLTILSGGTNTDAVVNISSPVYNSAQDKWTSDITLAAELDYEETSSMQLAFVARDSVGQNSSTLLCSLLVSDVNDEVPSFQGLPYDIFVPENTSEGTVLRAGITATDPDTGQGGTVFLLPLFPDSVVEAMFNASVRDNGVGQIMDVILAQPLDYEKRTLYEFGVMAMDGGGLNSSVVRVPVTVIDVQDTPPFFLQDSYRASIDENQPEGTVVIAVSALDGDRGVPNGIEYSIVRGGNGFFGIDNVTGIIQSLVELDRDDANMVGPDGVFELTVRATETDEGHIQYGNTTTDVTVMVTVGDVNDNGPTFSSSRPYTATVMEDTPSGALIFFDGQGSIFVSDADQGQNSHFNLTVERDGVPWPRVMALPSEVYFEAQVMLRVVDTNVFRDVGGSQIRLKMVAREVSTAEGHSSTADIVINVQQQSSPLTATSSDEITVPVIILLVIALINAVVNVIVVYRVCRRPETALVRKGSIYYVNGQHKESRGGGGGQGSKTDTGLDAVSDSVLREVEGKDRCDVVPLSAVLADKRASTLSHTSTNSNTATIDCSSNGFNFDTLGTDLTDRKVLLANEVSPAKSSKRGSAASSSQVVDHHPASSTPNVTTIPTADPAGSLSFSRAKRHISSQQSPALTLSVQSPPTTAASRAAGSASSLSEPYFMTSASSNNSTQSLEPVTTFAAQGSVSTTMHAVVHNPIGGVQSTTQQQQQQPDVSEDLKGESLTSVDRSVSEILY